jgi:hypothetical protein
MLEYLFWIFSDLTVGSYCWTAGKIKFFAPQGSDIIKEEKTKTIKVPVCGVWTCFKCFLLNYGIQIILLMDRVAPDTEFAGYPAGRIYGESTSLISDIQPDFWLIIWMLSRNWNKQSN